MDRYICVHGHFYQPPRENPWLEAIETQDEAYPYHDWNERITAECYAPNAASRILDDADRIVKIVNNYASISFNFGPTLLSWLETQSPDVYRAILDADKQSAAQFSGHGSAMAQAYNHMILPLANARDRHTQVAWGVRDFEHRFGRRPEGMWLPETAVDLTALDELAAFDIRFTILSPYQARRVRLINSENWDNVEGGKVDTTQPYKINLPSGRAIAVFFYHGGISQAIAFDHLLSRGEVLVDRMMQTFSDPHDRAQLVHIATDGETYGHHHRFGDMALAYALHHIQNHQMAKVTNYGEYLELHPPTHEAEIIENTSWSCSHGVERWRADCGCHTGANPQWNQAWREPLRTALDWLRDATTTLYEQKSKELLKDPWAARNDYINVVLDRSVDTWDKFLNQHATARLTDSDKIVAIKLLELQRQLMLMYTSCGWFFDEVSRVEPVQCLQYAAAAIYLSKELFGEDLEPEFERLLSQAPSNDRQYGDAGRVYRERVKPAAVDMQKVCAHYAASCLFEPYADKTNIYCYTVGREDHCVQEAGRVKLAIGCVTVRSNITGDSTKLSFGVLHFGDHNVTGGVRVYGQQALHKALTKEVSDAFTGGDLPQAIRLLDKHFVEMTISLKSLFRDEQRKVRDLILKSPLAEVESAYRHLYDHHGSLIHYLAGLDIPLPKAFHGAVEFVVNTDLLRAFEAQTLDLEAVRSLLDDTQKWGITLDTEGLAYAMKNTLERQAKSLRSQPDQLSIVKQFHAIADLVGMLPFEVDLQKTQNIFYDVAQHVWPRLKDHTQQGDAAAKQWGKQFISLGEKLRVKVE